MADRLRRRKETQPLEMPSAGSCFRNPEGTFAWKLIDGIGYRGKKVNGICVSEKHSNFIVNEGGGTAEDYLGVAYQIIDKVKEKYGIKLVMEVEKFNC
jgi:UDP-N-acetylmuramate dehydrogenase